MNSGRFIFFLRVYGVTVLTREERLNG